MLNRVHTMASYYKAITSVTCPTLSLYLMMMTIHALIDETQSFQCYVCDSKNDVECMEKLPHDTRLAPQDCNNITDAKYCIKTTNIYAGEFGTKRFCAANDHGNYCKYIRQPTGDREYRSCVLTCSSDNCNGASGLLDHSSLYEYMSLLMVTVTLLRFLT